MFNLGEAILALLEIVFGFWNNQVSLVFELLGQSPTGFKGGGPWGIIEGIEPLFVGIGSALVVLFFVIGFCAESVDIREEIRFEAILRMFIRVAIAQWLVSYNIHYESPVYFLWKPGGAFGTKPECGVIH